MKDAHKRGIRCAVALDGYELPGFIMKPFLLSTTKGYNPMRCPYPRKFLFPVTCALFTLTGLSAPHSEDWGQLATISSTMGVNAGRLCMGEASRGDIGCPAYAPSISPNGTMSLTTGETTWGYLGSAASYLPNLNTNNISVTTVNGSAVGGIPAGAVMAFDLAACPAGWSEYTAARGRFLRGMDNGAGNDPSGTRVAGDVQEDGVKSHLHMVDPPVTNTSVDGNHTHGLFDGSSGSVTGFTNNYTGNNAGFQTVASMGWYHTGLFVAAAGAHQHALNIPAFNSAATGGAETRPKNVAVLFCRKS